MEIIWRTRNRRLAVKIEARTQKDAFEAIATAQEVFEAAIVCGCCRCDAIRFQVRAVDNIKHYELACKRCDARFEFGQHKTGDTLFPKRRDEQGNPLPNGGWKVWKQNSTTKEESR